MFTKGNEHRPNAKLLEKSCSGLEQCAVLEWIVGCSRVDHSCHGKSLGTVRLDRCDTSPPQGVAWVWICGENLACLRNHRANLINEILGKKSFAVVLKDYALHLWEQ